MPSTNGVGEGSGAETSAGLQNTWANCIGTVFDSISLDACEHKTPETLDKYRQLIAMLQQKYEFAKQNAEYLSTPVSYLKVIAATTFARFVLLHIFLWIKSSRIFCSSLKGGFLLLCFFLFVLVYGMLCPTNVRHNSPPPSLLNISNSVCRKSEMSQTSITYCRWYRI